MMVYTTRFAVPVGKWRSHQGPSVSFRGGGGGVRQVRPPGSATGPSRGRVRPADRPTGIVAAKYDVTIMHRLDGQQQ